MNTPPFTHNDNLYALHVLSILSLPEFLSLKV